MQAIGCVSARICNSNNCPAGIATQQEHLRARLDVQTSAERLRLGEHLLVFPEGARSRDGALQRCLAAVARYLSRKDAFLLPFGHVGCDQLFPVDSERVYPAQVHMRLGRPVPIGEFLDACGRSRQQIADVIGFLIADLLPPTQRGVYGETSAAFRDARAIAKRLSR